MNNIAPQSPVMRRLTQQDNPAIARVIRQVSAEYGLTADKGYTVADPNLDELYQVYSQPGHAYWVVEYEGEVVGGGGIAPLAGSESDICELQKMYFLPAIRGKGLAKKLALMAMEQAREMGFKRCYLETTAFLPSFSVRVLVDGYLVFPQLVGGRYEVTVPKFKIVVCVVDVASV